MDMLKICIGQGYVPADCKLDGMLVWLLINDGKNPCDGCNADCVHRRCSSDCVKERYIREELERINKEELEYRERIKKRKVLGTNSETIIYVDTDYDSTMITAINPDSERGYVVRCRNGADEAARYIEMMSAKYNARQVIIPLNGYGIAVYDCLKARDLKYLDIVPIKCVSAKL